MCQYLMLVYFSFGYLQAAGALSIKIGKFDEYLQMGFYHSSLNWIFVAFGAYALLYK